MTDPEMRSPYRGLTPYTEADASYFFGRSAEIATIAANLEVARLTVLYGPSGVGKTSVLRAGVIHQLQQRAQANFTWSGRPENIPVYFSHWQYDPLAGLAEASAAAVQPFLVEEASVMDGETASTAGMGNETAPEAGFITALRTWTSQTGSTLLFVLDQFEEYFLYHAAERGPGSFASVLSHAVNSPGLRANFLLSLREDALARLDRFKGEIPFLLDNRLSIAHLRRQEGYEAVTRPLLHYNTDHGANYSVEPALVESVLDQVARGKVVLAHQGAGMAGAEVEEGRIEAPYLQLVLTRLWAEETGRGSTLLRRQTLDELGGAEKIVSNYLDETMAGLPASRQAIAARFFDRLVTLGGAKIALSLDELTRYAKADPAAVRYVLQELQAKRLLRGVRSPAGETLYEIFHDVLAQAILDWQSRVPWRTAEHYLEAGLFDWRAARKTRQSELLLDYERYHYIWLQKGVFDSLTGEANEFLARTALYHGDSSFSHWISRLVNGEVGRVNAIISDYVLHQNEGVRKAAQSAILQAKQRCLLGERMLERLVGIFWNRFQSPSAPATRTPEEEPAGDTIAVHAQPQTPAPKINVREATSPLLWALRSFLSLPNRLRVAPVALRVWVRDHRASPVFVASASSLIVALLVLAGWRINENLRGSWQRESLVLAGSVSTTWLRSDPNIVYVMTPTGREVGSRATLWLYNRKTDQWRFLKQNLTSDPVLGLAVVEVGNRRRLYLSTLGTGLRRSDDNGATWQPINVGLHSYVIGKLVKDENDPNILYAGSLDSSGVFESRDGGDSWEDISGEELFGASILAMTYTNYEGGALIVSTSDARMFARKRGGTTWIPIWSYPLFGAVNALSPEATERQTVYAGTARGYVAVSLDGGGTWHPLPNKPPVVFGVNAVAAVPGRPHEAFLSTYGIGGNLIWKTEDRGESWSQIKDSQFTRESVFITIHEYEPDTLFAVGLPGFFETHSAGDSWLYRNPGAPIASIHRVAISPLPGGPTYAAVSGAIFSRTESLSKAWQRGYGVTALSVRTIVADPVDPARAFAGVYLPNRWSVLITENSGRTWQPAALPEIRQNLVNDTMALEIAKTEGSAILYAGTNGCGVIHSIDKGGHWESFGRRDCTLDPSAPKNVIDIAVDPHDADTIYVAADGTRVYVSQNRGQTWRGDALTLSHEIGEIEVDPEIPGRIYLIAGADGFWRSDDGGETWRRYSRGLEEKLLNNLVADASAAATLYLSSYSGEIWKTTDGGVRWTYIRENLTASTILDMTFDRQSKELVLSSGEAGLYRLKPGSLLGNRKE
jgi:photosystem II stability/assembly factor-like uncharacterized protein